MPLAGEVEDGFTDEVDEEVEEGLGVVVVVVVVRAAFEVVVVVFVVVVVVDGFAGAFQVMGVALEELELETAVLSALASWIWMCCYLLRGDIESTMGFGRRRCCLECKPCLQSSLVRRLCHNQLVCGWKMDGG
jgi:hypothetical protein